MMELQIAKAAPAGVYIAFAAALYVWHVAAALVGVLVADRLGVSDASADLKSDLKKIGLCSLIALSLFFSLFYFAQNAAVFLVYIVSFLFSLKIAYLGANHGFLLVVLGSAMAGMITFVPLVQRLKLPGMLFLYLAFLVALLIRRQLKKQRVGETKESEKRKEHAVREQVRRDPEFTTFCYQCLFSREGGGRCQLRIDGEEVHEIKIGPRSYCTSFRLNPEK
jgi:hypothetical protein